MPGLDPVVFLSPSSIGTAIEITVADINSPTELNSVAASSGDIVIARTVSAATDQYTYYIADTTSDAQSLPWIVSSSTSGVKFIASAGHAVNNSVRFASTIRLNSLTASRIVTLDSNKDSATPATVTTDQSVALTGSATLNVAALTASRLLRTDSSKNLESNAALTNTRVLYADSNGWPTDSANFTFSGTLLTLGTGATSGLTIAATTGTTLTVSSTTDSTTKDTGSIVTEGGIGVEKAVSVGTDLRVAGLSGLGGATNSLAVLALGATNPLSGTTQIGEFINMTGTSAGTTALRGIQVSLTTAATSYTVTSAVGFFIGTISKGAGSTITSAYGLTTNQQTNGGTSNVGFLHGSIGSEAAGNWAFYDSGTLNSAFCVGGTGGMLIGTSSTTGLTAGGLIVAGTTDATSSSTGALQTSGGANVAKNLLARQGSGKGLTSTATAAGTTTLTNASTQVQIFTGTTTQTLQLPAANLFGSGIAVEYIVINRSTGTVTAQRAGSDTFDGGGTTDAILTNTTRHYLSNGSNQWHTIA